MVSGRGESRATGSKEDSDSSAIGAACSLLAAMDSNSTVIGAASLAELEDTLKVLFSRLRSAGFLLCVALWCLRMAPLTSEKYLLAFDTTGQTKFLNLCGSDLVGRMGSTQMPR